MPDDTSADLNAKVNTFLKKLEDAAVKQHKIDRTYARETLREHYRDRIVVGGRGPVRILRPGTLEFYEGGIDDEDIMAPVLSELVQACPDEHRLEAVADRQKRLQEIEEEKARSGAYRL